MNIEEMWRAVLNNDKKYDGEFFYAVKSTGIFCKPSCASKTPLRENIEFFEASKAAMEAGYRACKRCRPDLICYQPISDLAEKAKTIIDNLFIDKAMLSNELRQLGISRRHLTEVFVTQYGCTPNEYANIRRIEKAKTMLENGDESVLDIAMTLGFNSLSYFYTFFKKNTKMALGDYRNSHRMNKLKVDKTFFTYNLMLGDISIGSDGEAVTAVQFANELPNHGIRRSCLITDKAAYQLEEYFAGKRKVFDLLLNPTGTVFQKSVWSALQQIPYGKTKSYKQVAEMTGNANASRAVGMANNKNPILILIPCHRVVGTNGSLVGYAALLEIKKQLLELEQKNM